MLIHSPSLERCCVYIYIHTCTSIVSHELCKMVLNVHCFSYFFPYCIIYIYIYVYIYSNCNSCTYSYIIVLEVMKRAAAKGACFKILICSWPMLYRIKLSPYINTPSRSVINYLQRCTYTLRTKKFLSDIRKFVVSGFVSSGTFNFCTDFICNKIGTT